jgi:beta-glucosidase-like glycosyl hydrolase
MKHWTAYGVESNRMGFDGRGISLHDLSDSYFKPLKMCVLTSAEDADARVSSAMCAYDAINGVPSCANSWMNDKVLRQTWYLVPGTWYWYWYWYWYECNELTAVGCSRM